MTWCSTQRCAETSPVVRRSRRVSMKAAASAGVALSRAGQRAQLRLLAPQLPQLLLAAAQPAADLRHGDALPYQLDQVVDRALRACYVTC